MQKMLGKKWKKKITKVLPTHEYWQSSDPVNS